MAEQIPPYFEVEYFFVPVELSVFILPPSQRQNKKAFLCVLGVSSEAGG